MPRYFATAAATVALAVCACVPTAAPATPVATSAKTCRSGYVHAVIGGSEKCLRRGEFCAHRLDRQYRRYGFHCTRRDSRGSYHLS